jgi:hypothetical protein
MKEERDGLVNYMLELVEVVLEDLQGVRYDKFWEMEITERGIPGEGDHQRSNNIRLYKKKIDHS